MIDGYPHAQRLEPYTSVCGRKAYQANQKEYIH